jgi:hypothetical protein
MIQKRFGDEIFGRLSSVPSPTNFRKCVNEKRCKVVFVIAQFGRFVVPREDVVVVVLNGK